MDIELPESDANKRMGKKVYIFNGIISNSIIVGIMKLYKDINLFICMSNIRIAYWTDNM